LAITQIYGARVRRAKDDLNGDSRAISQERPYVYLDIAESLEECPLAVSNSATSLQRRRSQWMFLNGIYGKERTVTVRIGSPNGLYELIYDVALAHDLSLSVSTDESGQR
jgi:hypothetical protein